MYITNLQTYNKNTPFQGKLKLTPNLKKRLKNDSLSNLQIVYNELDRIGKINDGKVYYYIEKENDVSMESLFAFEKCGYIIDENSNILASKRITYMEELQDFIEETPNFISDLIFEFTNKIYPRKKSAIKNAKSSLIKKITDLVA